MATERLQLRINSLLDEAEEAIVNSDWELVRNRAQNALALEPENDDALALVAAAQRAMGAPEAPVLETAPAGPTTATGPSTEPGPGPSTSGTDLPSGMITYLFTDVQGSTPLWQQHPNEMRDVVARHDSLMTATVEANGGTVVRPRGEGDSIFAVFLRATDAVAAACAAQQQLLTETWPGDISISVRMAMHTGESE